MSRKVYRRYDPVAQCLSQTSKKFYSSLPQYSIDDRLARLT